MPKTPKKDSNSPKLPDEIRPLELKDNTVLSRLKFNVGRTARNAAGIVLAGTMAGTAAGKIAQHSYRDTVGYDPNRMEVVDEEQDESTEEEVKEGMFNRAKNKALKILKTARTITSPEKAKEYLKNTLTPLLKNMFEGAFKWGDNAAFWTAFMAVFVAAAVTTKYLLGLIQMSAEDEINKKNNVLTETAMNELIEHANSTTAYLTSLKGGRQVLATKEQASLTQSAQDMMEDLTETIEEGAGEPIETEDVTGGGPAQPPRRVGRGRRHLNED